MFSMNAMNAMILNGNSAHSTINSSKVIVDGYDECANGKYNMYAGQQYERQSYHHSSHNHSPAVATIVAGPSLVAGVLVRLRVLLDAYDMLATVYTQKREITHEDVHACVVASFNRSKHRPMTDTSVYVSLIVESLVPKIANDGTIKLQIKPTHDLHDKAARYHIVTICLYYTNIDTIERKALCRTSFH